MFIDYRNIITSSFLEELTKVISKVSISFENFILMGAFSIDTNLPILEHNKLEELCVLFDLKE